MSSELQNARDRREEAERLSPLVVVVTDHVDNDGSSENQHVVLAVRDLDSVGVSPAEPALRDSGDDAASARDHVLVVEKIALGLAIAVTAALVLWPERILSRNARALYAIDDAELHRPDDRDTWINDIGPAATA